MKMTLRKLEAALLAVSLVVGSGGAAAAPGVQAAQKKTGSYLVKVPKKTLYTDGKKSKAVTTLKVRTLAGKKVKKVKFSSSNKKVASVSAKGKVTAKKPGKVTITITVKGNSAWKKKVKIKVKKSPLAFAKKKVYVTLSGTAAQTKKKLTLYGGTSGVSYQSDNSSVASVTKTGNVKAKRMGTAVITAKNKKGKQVSCTVVVEKSGQAIHDPSVYRDPQSGRYYTFGSHVTAAVSTNLIGWSAAANSYSNYSAGSTLFSKSYTKEFAEAYAYTMPDGAKENAWAPDIIYNPAMGKYCMYQTIVDGSTKCCIAMASADKPDGPYHYQGMIVCSGMETNGSDIDKTNVAEALGMTEEEAKKSKYATLGTNSPDCIDATVFFDHEGKLWMVYGSFTTTGGIRLLKLDAATGLRGENYDDSGEGCTDSLSIDDPYYGKKIANSNGEGPYIQMIANNNSATGYYYYLWTSVGNLQYYGGYNMRVVRAENPEGPYVDPKGNRAVDDIQKYALGLRVMDNYKFSFMDTAFVSQGGNSATDDGTGRTFIQFHTRTQSSDSYTFRTHQTFINEDGWPVTAPFEYNGEKIAESYEKEAVIGDYELIYHRETFAKTTIKNKDILQSVRLSLCADGTVTGAYEGTWSLTGHDITISINGQTYKGVVLEQYEQTEKRKKVMVFTAAGSDNRCIWGTKMHKTDKQAVTYDSKQLSVPEEALEDFELPTKGLFRSTVAWSSNSDSIRVENGKAVVKKGAKAVTVTLTAAVSRGSEKTTKKFQVKVTKDSLSIDTAVDNDRIILPSEYAGEKVTWTSSDPSVITADGTVNQPETGYRKLTMVAQAGAEKKSFEVVVLPKEKGETVYENDYHALVSDRAIAEVWNSPDKQNCFYVESDAGHDSFVKFAAGNTSSSQGAQSIFNVTDRVGKTYVASFDVALEAGSADETEFALTGSDAMFEEGDMNAGLTGGYIVKLSAKNSTSWTINDSEQTFELPVTWVRVTAVVDTETKKAAVMIADEKKQYFGGEVRVAGNGKPNGLYLHWAQKQSLISVDNVSIRTLS